MLLLLLALAFRLTLFPGPRQLDAVVTSPPGTVVVRVQMECEDGTMRDSARTVQQTQERFHFTGLAPVICILVASGVDKDGNVMGRQERIVLIPARRQKR